ncbi:MAG: NADH-quinone oxidoreductase subunit M [Planctomycetota bacterium]|nr:NADH-quinone oxidoreductase subunit M [Planctomycetota bacterium]
MPDNINDFISYWFSDTLSWIIFLPVVGMFFVLAAPSRYARSITFGTTLIVFLFACSLYAPFIDRSTTAYGAMEYEKSVEWISFSGGDFTINYHIGLDSLSYPLVVLTTLIGWLAAFASWNFDSWKVNRGAKGYFALFLLLQTGILGTFASLDFFLFYVFWEVMLLPMYFLIGVWGGERKEYAAIKFFLFTLAGSVLMLVALLAMYFGSAEAMGGAGTFSLVEYAVNPTIHEYFNSSENTFLFDSWNFGRAMFVMLFIGFAIKVPVFPFHTWLPDAHVEAPTPISMILAGVLLKLGAYGFLRVCYPIFPESALWAAKFLAVLGLVNIIYGALCAMAQSDFKRLVAYSSISHMGYVLLGIAIMTTTGFQGAMFQILAHGISSPMCFFLVGVIYDRAHHRVINRFGGLWLSMPKYGSLATIGFFASLGLPALCGFIGEFWVLIGTYQASGFHSTGYAGDAAAQIVADWSWTKPAAVIAAAGVVLTAGYILWLIQRVYLGKRREEHAGFPDITARETFILIPMAALAFFMGIMPKYTFMLVNDTLSQIVDIFKAGG